MRYFTIYNPGLWYKNRLKKGVGNPANPCLYIVVDITVEYNQEVRLKLSRKGRGENIEWKRRLFTMRNRAKTTLTKP